MEKIYLMILSVTIFVYLSTFIYAMVNNRYEGPSVKVFIGSLYLILFEVLIGAIYGIWSVVI